MATARADLKATISADSSQFDATMRRAAATASTAAAKISRGIESAASRFSSFAVGAAKAGAAMTALVGAAGVLKGVKLAADMQSTAIAFKTLTGSAETANKVLGEIQKLGADTPFEFPELADAGRKLIAFGEGADTVAETLRRIGDVSSGVQAPISEIAEIYGKARVQGRLFAEDINQLTGRGIPIIGELAKQFGVSESEVKKLVEEGKVGFPQLERAFASMTSRGGIFFGMMDEQSKSFNGRMSTLTDTVNEALRKIGEPIMISLIPLIESLTEKIASMDFAKITQDFGAKVSEIAEAMYQAADYAYQLGQRLVNGFMAAWTITKAMFSKEWWVAAALDFTATLLDGLNWAKAQIEGIGAMMIQAALELPNLIWNAFKFLSNKEFWANVASNLVNAALKFGLTMVNQLSKAIKMLADWDFEGLGNMADEIKKQIAGGGPKDFTFTVGDTVEDSIKRILAAGKKAVEDSKPVIDTTQMHKDADKVLGEIGKDFMYWINKPIETLPEFIDKIAKKYGEAVGAATGQPADKTAADKFNEQANEREAAGFKGLAGWSRMQAAKASGIGPGTNTMLSSKGGRWGGVANEGVTGGLGEKRRLRTSKDDKDAKKNLSIQEQQVGFLEQINSNVKSAITVA
jgi:tape measure domain-containing protein